MMGIPKTWVSRQHTWIQYGELGRRRGKHDFSTFNFKSLHIEVAVKDSQLLLGMERCALQVECTFIIPDNFVYSPCNNKILGLRYFSAILVIWVAHSSSYLFLIYLFNKYFFKTYVGQSGIVSFSKQFA